MKTKGLHYIIQETELKEHLINKRKCKKHEYQPKDEGRGCQELLAMNAENFSQVTKTSASLPTVTASWEDGLCCARTEQLHCRGAVTYPVTHQPTPSTPWSTPLLSAASTIAKWFQLNQILSFLSGVLKSMKHYFQMHRSLVVYRYCVESACSAVGFGFNVKVEKLVKQN